MSTSRFSLFHRPVTFMAMLGLLLVAMPTVFAAGTETKTIRTSETLILTGDEGVFPPPPCQGVPGTVTLTINTVLHETETANGSFHEAGTFTGVQKFIPDDPAQPSYTGHFASRFGINTNSRTFTYTGITNILAKGSDGSLVKLHETYHLTKVDDTVIAEVDKPRCG